MVRKQCFLAIWLFTIFNAQTMFAQYPSLLTFPDGKSVTSENWELRREQLLDALRTNMYGYRPNQNQVQVTFQPVVSADDGNALGGLAERRQVKIRIQHKSKPNRSVELDLLIYLPRNPNDSTTCPVILGLNFIGNHTIQADPAVPVFEVPSNNSKGQQKNKKQKKTKRGQRKNRWPVELAIKNGFGVATLCYHQIDPDFDDGFTNGVHALFESGTIEKDLRWGSISAWAWGLSLAMDYLETDPRINAQQVAVLGHSRLGKTALWAGATDPRFAIVISNNSGCGGAAASRREKGETIERITTVFPHWFCKRLNRYRDRVHELPVDQHFLIAASAPRPVYVASASQDAWADPQGEFLSLQMARPAYELLGKNVAGLDKMPPNNMSIGNTLGYHIREGKHDLKRLDWELYLKFCSKHFSSSK